jgi:hypothetical protein
MIKKIIFFTVLFLFVFLININAQENLEKVFYFHLIIYSNDTVTLTNFEVIEGIPTIFPNIPLELNYTVIIFSTKNEIFFKAQIPVSFKAYPMPPEGEPEIIVNLNESEQYIRLSYFEDVDRIEIYHDDKLIFSHKICEINNICEELKGENAMNCPEDCVVTTTILSTTTTTSNIQKTVCGNNICEVRLRENYGNCPKDCPSGQIDKYCDGIPDGICDSDCVLPEQDPDCVRGSKMNLVYVFLGVIIVIASIVLFMNIRKEKIEST